MKKNLLYANEIKKMLLTFTSKHTWSVPPSLKLHIGNVLFKYTTFVRKIVNADHSGAPCTGKLLGQDILFCSMYSLFNFETIKAL